MSIPVLTFDVTLFREQFPAFADPIIYPDALLQMYWDMATCYVTDSNCGVLMNNCRQLAINLMTAHLTYLATQIQAGEITGLLNSAGIDKINIGLTPPPLPNQWQWWLNTSPYGAQLLALLQARSAGGFYIGGLPEQFAIRKVGGTFR